MYLKCWNLPLRFICLSKGHPVNRLNAWRAFILALAKAMDNWVHSLKMKLSPFFQMRVLTVLFSLAVDHFYQDEVAFGQASGISANPFSATNHFFIHHVTWHLWCYKLVQEVGHPFHLLTKGSVLMFSEVIYFCFRGQCSFALLLHYQENKSLWAKHLLSFSKNDGEMPFEKPLFIYFLNLQKISYSSDPQGFSQKA